ncbi:hypothetical protein VCV18_006080 [Metarhizium anisopliae]
MANNLPDFNIPGENSESMAVQLRYVPNIAPIIQAERIGSAKRRITAVENDLTDVQGQLVDVRREHTEFRTELADLLLETNRLAHQFLNQNAYLHRQTNDRISQLSTQVGTLEDKFVTLQRTME